MLTHKGDQLPLFSIPSVLRTANDIAKFLDLCVIHQNLVEHVNDLKRFQE